jgi:hypothetical protein
MENRPLMVGVRVREVATRDGVYTDCRVLHADTVGLAFEVERTVSEGGTVESVMSQILVPWVNVKHVIVVEERT